MLGEMKKLKSLVIMTSCVLLTGAIFPGKLTADTAIEEWVARYNGAENSGDWANAIALDTSGNVYVTGTSSTGTEQDYATVKYAPDGTQLWVARYNGPGNSTDAARAIALDTSGNVYVTGESDGGGTGEDYATIKYAPDGTQLWVARYNGAENSADRAYAIAVDTSGNVYVTGPSWGGHPYYGGTSYDYATVKYDTDGNEKWVRRYNGPANYGDEARAIAIDSSDNVYVTGTSSTGTEQDYATVKYAADGTQLWVARYNGPGNSTDAARAIALDTSGNVYVTGESDGGGTGEDYATIKYAPDGTQLWVARYDGPGNARDRAFAIAVDSSSNVYVTGMSYGSGTDQDYATVKYKQTYTDGSVEVTEEWVARYNGPGNSWDYATELALDSSGNVYVAGGSVGSGVVNDYATVKYDADTGQQLWVARYDSPRNYTDVACAIAVDSSGKVYVTGYSAGIGTDWDYATIKYSQIPTQPPVAVCQDVTVMADSYCEGVVAPEDVDNGSSDPDGDPVTLSLSPEGPYPIGTTAVTLTVTDDQGASSACTATVKVLTASEGTLQLVAKVMVLNLQNGIENSLDTKLDAALQALDDLNTNNDVAAINAIEAFINHVQAQSGNQISEADADDLIDTANKIIVGLQNGCY